MFQQESTTDAYSPRNKKLKSESNYYSLQSAYYQKQAMNLLLPRAAEISRQNLGRNPVELPEEEEEQTEENE